MRDFRTESGRGTPRIARMARMGIEHLHPFLYWFCTSFVLIFASSCPHRIYDLQLTIHDFQEGHRPRNRCPKPLELPKVDTPPPFSSRNVHFCPLCSQGPRLLRGVNIIDQPPPIGFCFAPRLRPQVGGYDIYLFLHAYIIPWVFNAFFGEGRLTCQYVTGRASMRQYAPKNFALGLDRVWKFARNGIWRSFV